MNLAFGDICHEVCRAAEKTFDAPCELFGRGTSLLLVDWQMRRLQRLATGYAHGDHRGFHVF